MLEKSEDKPAHAPRRLSGVKSIMVLGGGAATGQAMAMLFSPILTRLYDVEAFGVFGIFSALVSSIGAVATLKLEQAILLEKDEDGADRVLRTCVLVAAGIAILSACGFFALECFATSPAYRRVAPLLLMLGPINVFALGLFNGVSFWYTRAGAFKPLATYNFLRSAIAVVLQLGAAFVGRSATHLVSGQVAGLAIASLQLIRSGDSRLRSVLFRRYDFAAAVAVVRRYRTFVIFGAPQNLGRLLSQNLPAILLPLLFGPAQSGLFWLAYRMLILPSQIVTESTRSVFFRHAAEALKDGRDLRRVIFKPVLFLGLFSAVVSTVLWVAGPFLFGQIFGAQWREAGIYAALISIAWSFENIGMSSSVMISLLELQRIYLSFEVATVILRGLALYVGYRLGSAELAVALYAAVASLNSVMVIGYVQWALARRDAVRRG